MDKPVKTCGKCQEEKCTTEFTLNNAAADGLSSACRPCAAARAREARERAELKRSQPAVEFQTCKSCEEEKPARDYSRNVRNSTGLDYTCKDCVNQERKARRMMNKYGISLWQFQENRDLQDGKCAICKVDFFNKPMVVDHDHGTGSVRGLLCSQCNVGIGNLKDDTTVLQAAIDYLIDPPWVD